MAYNQTQYNGSQGQSMIQNPNVSYHPQTPLTQQSGFSSNMLQPYTTPQAPPNQPIIPAYCTPQGFGNQPPPMIPGRIVNTEEDIRANEIPGDGSIGLFPKADRSCIFMKYWDGTRGIATLIYNLQNTQESDDSSSENELMSIKEQLSRIEKKLNKSYFANRANKNGVKKEDNK